MDQVEVKNNATTRARQCAQNFFKVRRRSITAALALGFLGGTILSGSILAQTNEQGARWYSQDLAGLTSQASGLAEGDAAGLAINWAAGAPYRKAVLCLKWGRFWPIFTTNTKAI
jgi:hypothetical protein